MTDADALKMLAWLNSAAETDYSMRGPSGAQWHEWENFRAAMAVLLAEYYADSHPRF